MIAASLTTRVLGGDPRAIARAISMIEDGHASADELLRGLFAGTGRAFLIGITGPPGAGKSTLVDRLIGRFRAAGRTVGVVAVDPTSPFTGGALLGDRVRMQAHAEDEGVFIRSMATRGHLGGLARATSEVALVLDAAGTDVVLIETVGVGQDEVDIVRTADVSIVAVVPGAGDDVQALKAGIMEIGDIFVVNKADREGADRAAASIEAMLALQTFGSGDWRPPVVRTEATSGAGVADLVEAIERYRLHTEATTGQRRRARAAWRLRDLLAERFLRHVERRVLGPGELELLLDRMAARETDPYSTVQTVLERALGAGGTRPPNAPAVPRADDEAGRTGITGVHAGPDDIAADRPLPVSVDHVGIAVGDLERALAFYRDAVGMRVESSEEVPSQRVRAHFLHAGASALELIEATDRASPIARFLETRGPGLHHVALRVDDIAAALARLAASGVRLIDANPRPGAHGSLVAFIHPASAHGVLVELVQPADR